MAKKKTEIINEEIVETPAVEEAPKKKRGRPRKNPELSNEIKETADKVGQEIRKHFKEKAYKTYIPRNIKLSEAPSAGKSIFDYEVNSEGAKAYVSLTREVIANNTEVSNG